MERGNVVELARSAKRLPDEASYDEIGKFAVALSTPYPNPDLNANSEGFNGKPVPVVFTAEVPPKTSFGDDVYLATDVSGWSATSPRVTSAEPAAARWC